MRSNVIPTNSINSSINLYWSDEGSTSSNDYDLYILSTNGTSVVASSVNVQDGSEQPYESVDVVHPGEQIVIFKHAAAAARFLRLSALQDGAVMKFVTGGQTLGHAGTGNCIGVAASDATLSYPNAFTGSSPVENSSSDGPRKQFYKSDGTAVTPGNFLASGGTNIPNPDLTAADGVMTSRPGFNPFYGTSAAAPHAAAIAALVWSKKPALSNTQVRAILDASCIDIDLPGFDIVTGRGILMANLALSNAVPSINLTPTNILFAISGSNLNLRWPSDHTGWRLIAQTNHLSTGVSRNTNDWGTVAGSTATNALAVPISGSLPGEYYRLVYP